MTKVRNEAKRLARNAINWAIIRDTEGRRDITMMPQDSIDKAVEVLLDEDNEYFVQAIRNLGIPS